jgi:hypothetical protein
LVPREWISPIAIQHTVETHGDIFINHHQSTQSQQQQDKQQNKQKEKNHIV